MSSIGAPTVYLPANMPSSWPGLSPQVNSRSIIVNDLDVHIFEAKPREPPNQASPLLILLHGFPELAYSWRKVIVPLADAGYHVVAPDQRGYGQTKKRTMAPSQSDRTHDNVTFEDDPSPFRMLNLAGDIVSLVYALGYTSVAAVVGHDFGSAVAGHCALMRPDLFKSVVLMSAPYTGTPAPRPNESEPSNAIIEGISAALAALTPPRKHYTVYYSTAVANADIIHAPQGLHAFLRAYYHVKSADWAENKPYLLPSLTAASMALLPHYYIMPLGDTMADTVARDAPSVSQVAGCAWLPDEELAVYVAEYTATGFQGGLNRYRCMTDAQWSWDLRVFAGKRVEVPAMFLSGKQDWGVFQYPGAEEKMRKETCVRMREEDFVLVDGAGHWVQQEAPEAVIKHILRFLSQDK